MYDEDTLGEYDKWVQEGGSKFTDKDSPSVKGNDDTGAGSSGSQSNTGLGKKLGQAADIAATLAKWSPKKRTSIGPVEDVRSGKQVERLREGEIDSLTKKERERLKMLT